MLDAVWSGDAAAVSSALRTAPQAATATYATSEGLATIHAAVQRGHTEVLHVLLEAGVAPDLPKQDGATALFLAAAKGQVESMQALLSAGAAGVAAAACAVPEDQVHPQMRFPPRLLIAPRSDFAG